MFVYFSKLFKLPFGKEGKYNRAPVQNSTWLLKTDIKKEAKESVTKTDIKKETKESVMVTSTVTVY